MNQHVHVDPQEEISNELSSYVVVDGAQHPEQIGFLVTYTLGLKWASVYAGTLDEKARDADPGDARLFVMKLEDPDASWLTTLVELHRQDPCLIHVRTSMDIESLAGHLQGFLYADLEGGLRYMVRYFDARNIAAVLNIWSPGIREAFLSPLADLHYRPHESEWQQIVGYNRPRQPFLPRITLTQAQEDQLIEHAQPADMLYRFAKGGFIDARLPYAQRHAQLERYAKRARAWGFSNTRDVEIFCRYCCCNGEDFDRTPETTAVLHSLLAEQTSLKALPGLIVLNLPPYLAITGLLE
ncbi:MAG: DUF4123 domain-containing protein [Silvimonas sp.]|nr:DUF4123 domain-containing protein [Silvimonas sp.]